ncbi:MAG TPA: LysM domain-containing protein, partial [Anaerolineae bacterium]|nr:LysM domain-containing protein [Anaerolineae bacterium]
MSKYISRVTLFLGLMVLVGVAQVALASAIYVVQAGDSLSGIALRYNV